MKPSKPNKQNRPWLYFTLLNLGIFLAIAWAGWGQLWRAEKPLQLTQYLALNSQQVSQWQDAEHAFLIQLKQNEQALHAQRNQLIQAVFADELILDQVQHAREQLAQLQNQQQKIVLEQLLAERALLNKEQRYLLQQLLLQQGSQVSHYEKLHQQNK